MRVMRVTRVMRVRRGSGTSRWIDREGGRRRGLEVAEKVHDLALMQC